MFYCLSHWCVEKTEMWTLPSFVFPPHTQFKRIFGVMEGIEEQQAIPLFWLKPKEGLVGRGSALYHWSTGEIPAARYVSSQRWKLRYWPGAAKGKYTKRVLFLTFPIKSSFCKKKKAHTIIGDKTDSQRRPVRTYLQYLFSKRQLSYIVRSNCGTFSDWFPPPA